MELLDRAVLAMVGAIELYNKPGFPYRNESFVILAINAWELLLKAKWLELHGHKKHSLYVYEHRQTKTGNRNERKFIKRTRSEAPFTHDIGFLTDRLRKRNLLSSPAFHNIGIMLEFRDCAIHFFNESPTFYTRLYEIGAACVKNFANAVDEWFHRDVSEFNFHLMPLTFMSPPSNVRGSLPKAEEKNFLEFVNSVDETDADPESRYSVSVNVELKFTKSKATDALSVQVTDHPSALPVRLTEEQIRERYPWDYAMLTDRLRNRYDDFKENQQYHEIRKSLQGDERFGRIRYLDPGNPKSTTKPFFNPNIMFALDKYYTRKESN